MGVTSVTGFGSPLVAIENEAPASESSIHRLPLSRSLVFIQSRPKGAFNDQHRLNPTRAGSDLLHRPKDNHMHFQ